MLNNMQLETWIRFDKPGEKKELEELLENNSDRLTQLSLLQEKFNLSLYDAQTVIETYFKRIKKS